MKIVFDEKYGAEKRQYVDWYLPESENFDLLIWFHGGGLEGGSRKDISFAEDLVKNNIGVCSVEYSLYPDAKFPDFITDCAKAVSHCISKMQNYRKSGRTYISGQSAGAYITLMLCLDKHYLTDVNVDRNGIDGYISDSAQTTTHFNVLREKGVPSSYERIDEAAPLYFVSDDCDFKALLLLCYENDMPCRVTQNKLLKESLDRNVCDKNIVLKVLEGGHVNGSVNRNKGGTFDFADEVLAFMNK